VAAVPFSLPAKKRAIVAPPSEDAAPLCLLAKKRAYAPPADAVLPACLSANERASAQQRSRRRMWLLPHASAAMSRRRFCPGAPTDQQAHVRGAAGKYGCFALCRGAQEAHPRARASAGGRAFRPSVLTSQQARDAVSIHELKLSLVWHCQRSQASRIQQTRRRRHHS